MPKSVLHTPVLEVEVLRALEPSHGESYLDVTAGYGGHAETVLAKTQAPKLAVLVDRDKQAVSYLKKKFAGSGSEIINRDFLSVSRDLAEQGKQFDIVLADLGASSPHFDDITRGFSFTQAGPLDMRMDAGQQLTADDIVNRWDGPELTRIIAEFGEEPANRRIAKAIVAARPVRDTAHLADLIAKAKPASRWKRQKIHPATKTFQAIRIAVNGELEQLEKALPIWLELLAPGGRLAIISFHSLEDRIVKKFFRGYAGSNYDSVLTELTYKPVGAKPDEIAKNPRARSAKLRAAAKIKIYPPKISK